MARGTGRIAPARLSVGPMQFFRRFSPFRAYRDLRRFLAQRKPYELGFLALAILLTGLTLIGFYKDSNIEPVYRPNIIYVQQWPANRTDAQIVAQQKIDQVAKEKQEAEVKKREDETRAEFKRLDDKLNKLGI
jgi:hypothetical protein